MLCSDSSGCEKKNKLGGGGWILSFALDVLILRNFWDIWLEPFNRLVKIMGLTLKGFIRFKNIVLRISKIKVLVKTIRVNCFTKLTTSTVKIVSLEAPVFGQ